MVDVVYCNAFNISYRNVLRCDIMARFKIFCLTEDGLEDPNCEIIEIIRPRVLIHDPDLQQITFKYGDDTYTGVFSFQSLKVKWANNTQCDAMIESISLL